MGQEHLTEDRQLNKKHLLKKRFFLKYHDLVDFGLAKRNLSDYKKKLDLAQEMTKNIDFNMNLLLVCEQDLAKEIFLAGFARMQRYKSFRFFNISELLDIQLGTKWAKNMILNNEDLLSTLEIKEDVLCVTINYQEKTNKYSGEVVAELITHRAMGRHNFTRGSGDSLYTWVFSLGKTENLNRYFNVRDLFIKPVSPSLFACYDLNTLKRVTEIVPTTTRTEDGPVTTYDFNQDDESCEMEFN